jgi:hypothetical protein
MGPTAWLLGALLATAPGGAAPESVRPIGLDILNPSVAGHRVLHLEDRVGPKARAADGREPARAALIVATGLGCALCETYPARLEALRRRLGDRALIVLLVLSKPAEAAAARARFEALEASHPVALDVWGLARRRLGLPAPTTAVVVRSDGSVSRFGPGPKALDAAEAALVRETEEDAQ